jgi:sialate O-acetylesterase
MRIILPAILLVLFFPFFSFSQLRLPSVLSSGMVLQQNDSVNIWGWGNNSETMSITGSWDNKTYTTVVSNHGSWSRKIKTPAAGGPFTLTISRNGQDVVLTDVMIGEVWLCSGQSNMEWGYSNGARFIKENFLPAITAISVFTRYLVHHPNIRRTI